MNAPPLPLGIAEKASADIEEIAFYLAQQSPVVENRFYQAFDKTIRLLAKSPELGELCRFKNPKTKGMRVWKISGFPNHLIFYRPQEDRLEILRVLHGARDYSTIFEENNA